MAELSYEKSLEAAAPLKQMMDIAATLDVEYLTQALEEMRKRHSFLDSAIVLNPSPMTAIEQQDLSAAKIDQLDLMLKLASNHKRIVDLSIKLGHAKVRSNQLRSMFGY